MSVSKNAKTTGRTGFTLRTALRELIRTIPDVVYFKDKNRRYLVVNEAFVELCGLTNAEIIGKTDETIFPADLAASFRASDGRVFESGTVFRFEDAVRDPRGRRIVFETIKSPFRSASGNVAGILGISRDITARRRTEEALRESEERFRTLYENATVGLYRTTPEGRILLAGGHDRVPRAEVDQGAWKTRMSAWRLPCARCGRGRTGRRWAGNWVRA